MCGILVRDHLFLIRFYAYFFLDEDAKPMAAKYLTKWRPGFAERLKGSNEETKVNRG